MAKTDAVWGIDIGQCALKALRCRPHHQKDRIIADAFDFIEYPKILTQPDVNPEELIADALEQFLSRNSLQGDRVAVSVSGQSGLARFIKLPPVESKKIPDIVRFEARQQIPFDLNDVIWDYQRMGGGVEEEGFALETEIGLFAMKREAVFRALEPYQKAGIEVDFIQLAPLALYNWVLFDQMQDLPTAEDYDPENPPESIVIFSIGTDATDLVITNGYRVWQRSIPLGGNHFTKALTKDLKLTSAKAEHLKRNATAAQDPKAIFQAMRPVFNDLLTELQRSIGYFTNIDRNAKIGRVVALGNAMKLSGLQTYLTKSLGHEVERIDEYQGLVGPQVTGAPAFQENALSFAVSYGLALQGLGKAGLQTNLLPGEIVKDRLIRQKKPWAIAVAAILLLACTVGFAASSILFSSVKDDIWKSAKGKADGEIKTAQKYVDGCKAAEVKFEDVKKIGTHLVQNVDNRVVWAELLLAINRCLPRDPRGERPKNIYERNELHITNLDCWSVADVGVWYKNVQQQRFDAQATPGRPATNPKPGTQESKTSDKKDGDDGQGGAPRGPGWIVRLTGYHYHNPPRQGVRMPGGFEYGPGFVRKTLIESLSNGEVTLLDADRVPETVTTKELGIDHPVLINPKRVRYVTVNDPNKDREEAGVPSGGPGNGETVPLGRFDFVVEFCWQSKSPTQRKEAREALEAAGGNLPEGKE